MRSSNSRSSRLTDQYDLQKLLRRGFQVGQEPDLLEDLGGQILRLIDDDYDAPSLGMRGQQAAIQRIHHLLDAVAIGLVESDAQLLADREQEFHRRYARIQDHGHVGMMRYARQQRSHDRRLAGSHFAGQLNEAARLVDPVQEMRERLRVALTQIEVARIRCYRERLFDQAEKAGVHGCPMIPSSAVPRTGGARGPARELARVKAPVRIDREYRRRPHRAEDPCGRGSRK